MTGVAWAGAATLALLVARVFAAGRLGFGDAEALYACYALHPQPVYLDHPGLIGVVSRAVGLGGAPSPLAAHLCTALLATAAPWSAALAARAAGASWRGAALAAGALLLAPEISVGLFGFTPDLLLVLLFYGATGASAWGLRARPGSLRALGAALASGAFAGLACDAKAPGVLLLAGLALGWASPRARPHAKTLAPYAGLSLALLLLSPVVLDEIERGYPMLRHRLVDTQQGAGPSLRNLGALLGGQLVYVTPPLLFGAYLVARDLYRRRSEDAIAWLLFAVTVASAPLVALALLSRVAEPHWVAPLYLALPLHLARREGLAPPLVTPRLRHAAVATGIFAIAVAHLWVLSPLPPRWLGSSYVARYDLANDLYAWRSGLRLVEGALAQSLDIAGPARETTPPVVVGPHWTVCAQVHAALPPSVLVGCEGPISDDFERWLPRSTWERAPVLLYVTDDRFDGTPRAPLPGRHLDAAWRVDVRRGGVVVRHITVERWLGAASAALVSPEK